MKGVDLNDLSFDEIDELRDPRPETTDFDRVVEVAVTRRGSLAGLIAFGSGAAAMGTLMSTTSAQAQGAASRFAFRPIPIATDFTVHAPEGYEWQILARWGDALFSDAPAFDPATGIPAQGSDRVFGENTDGMEPFNIRGHQVIAVKHEYVNPDINLPAAQEGKPASADDLRLLQNLQGVTVMEIAEGPEGWAIVKDSPFNRRIHHDTPMQITGPAAGHDLLKTEADPTGTASLGTFNNRGAGKTPWGTYLTCEENFNSYFGSTLPKEQADAARPDHFKRYGIGAETVYDYQKFDARFDWSKTPNEPLRAGYVVEIDPADTTSTRRKRTALGRFKHENAACALTNNSRRKPEGKNAGGDAMEPVAGSPNPRAENGDGQIVRWYPEAEDHAAPRFRWDLSVMAGNPVVHAGSDKAGSANINEGNLFNSPDGMMFDTTGLLWIQTDGEDTNDGGFAGHGNNQMLAGDPATGRIERFLTGPNGAEVTGLTWSSDRRTMFAGIQHPGGNFPDGEGRLPRSSIVAVRRTDGALVG
ncbi:MAG: PhoX family phosphatase [Rhodobacterales bacterium]|nr:PhoX family phosphatase [Rhodobacterales bacterium]